MTQRRLNTKISQNVAKPLKGRRPRKTGATCQRFAPPGLGRVWTQDSGLLANSANSVPEKFTARAGTMVEMACL